MEGKTTETVLFEKAVESIEADHHTHRMSVSELVQFTDRMISAYRTVLIRRIEREPLPSHLSISTARAFSLVEDPGLHAINKYLQMIADRVGFVPEGPMGLGNPMATYRVKIWLVDSVGYLEGGWEWLTSGGNEPINYTSQDVAADDGRRWLHNQDEALCKYEVVEYRPEVY